MRLSEEQSKLQTDRDSVTLARAQNSAAIEAARLGLAHRKSQYADWAANLESRIRDATGALTARLREIDDEKLAHERAVEDLYREIERRKEAIGELEREYEERIGLLDVAEQRFVDDRRKLEAAAADLAREEGEVEEKVRQIEAPYQNLLDSIEERTKAVRGLEGQIRAAGATIGDLEKDLAQSSSVSQIVQRLSRTLETTKAKRVELRRELESAAAELHEVEQSPHSPRASSDRNLRNQAAKALETSQLLKQKVAQLSQDKAGAIRAKNFVAAKRISQQLKEGEEQLAVAEQNLATLNQMIEALDAEESHTRGAVRSAKQKVDDLSYDILATNYNFYESAIAVLDGLFELSPYGRKLLKPLQALLLSGIAYVEPPPKLDVEEVQRRIQELNTKLEAVVAKEDFETAATIQEDIDRLAARLAK
jgi:chromosome segregation ATPase